jgi:hypothetical protein
LVIGCPDARAKPELRVVDEAYRRLPFRELLNTDHRAEDLRLDQLVLLAKASNYGLLAFRSEQLYPTKIHIPFRRH